MAIADAPSRTFTVAIADEGAIPVPFDPRESFGRARPPVCVTVNGYRYRSTIAIMNGRTFVPLRRSHREAAGVAAGDTVTVTLALDTAPRVVMPPAELAAILADDPARRSAWDALSHTAQREHAEAIAGAKRPETRQRRLDRICAALAGV